MNVLNPLGLTQVLLLLPDTDVFSRDNLTFLLVSDEMAELVCGTELLRNDALNIRLVAVIRAISRSTRITPKRNQNFLKVPGICYLISRWVNFNSANLAFS